MKRLIIAILALTSAGTLWSQEKESLLLSGAYVNMPQYRMQGAGYTVSFQHRLSQLVSLEAGAGYTVTSRTIKRDEVINDVRLLDLNYHHAGYHFYAVPVLKIGGDRMVSLDLFAGPVVNYQSNVFDRNRYEITDSSPYIGRMTNIVYVNKVQEGTFFGGIAGLRINARTGENWRVSLAVNALFILRAVSSANANLGIVYSW